MEPWEDERVAGGGGGGGEFQKREAEGGGGNRLNCAIRDKNEGRTNVCFSGCLKDYVKAAALSLLLLYT